MNRNKEILDIKNAVKIFSEKMIEKFIQKLDEGYTDFIHKDNLESIINSFHQHIDKQTNYGGQEIDLSNLIMMIYFINNLKEL